MKDLDYNYVECNRSFLKLFNFFHESNVIGKNVRDIVPQEGEEIIRKNMDTLLYTREPQIYTYKLFINSQEYILSQLSTLIVEDGEITGILSIAKDITNEENLKIKLIEKICQLNSLLDDKKRMEAQKELFLVTLTHDLKNPVQAQLMSLKMLKNETIGTLNTAQKDILDTLLESSNYMQEMLYSILKTYKYDNGVIELQKREFNVAELVKTCLKEVSAFAKSKEIKIKFIPKIKIIYADYEQIRRVIANLINNAIKYAYKNTTLNINIDKNKENIIFEFSNKGYPIDEELKKHIFDKYASNTRGIGLGLYFSKKVIEAHGGRIRLETRDDLCKFIFQIPSESIESKALINW